MIIFYSGSSYSKCYPEREARVKNANIMMTFHEIHHKLFQEHKRFKQFVRGKKDEDRRSS